VQWWSRPERVLLVAPLLLLLIPFLIAPLLLGFLVTFTNIGIPPPPLQFVGLKNYATAFSDREFFASWRNILIFVLVAVPAELLIGLGIAHLLREPFRGRALLRIVLLVPWLVSPIANGVMWHFLFDLQIGLINYFPAWFGVDVPPPFGSLTWALPTAIATDVWHNAPLAAFLLLPGLIAIPAEQWDYALLEGATLLTRLRHIVIPWTRSLLLAVALLLIGATLGTSDSILILTGGGPGSATMTPGLYSYLQAFRYQFWSVGATAAWLIVASMLLIGFIYLRLVRPETRP
jgi:ABC-type sugar transport system permease subunit